MTGCIYFGFGVIKIGSINMIVKKINFLFLSFIVSFSVGSMKVNGQNEITKADIKKYAKEYKKYVLNHQKNINRWYEWFIVLGAKRRRYNEFSIRLIPIAYKFFKDKENQLKKALDAVCAGDEKDLEYINKAIDKQRNKDKNALTKILHEMHVNSLTLSNELNRESLLGNAEFFKKQIHQGNINEEEYDRVFALNTIITLLSKKITTIKGM